MTRTIAEQAESLVTAVAMVEAPSGTDAEWESVWASLSFETAGVNATPAP